MEEKNQPDDTLTTETDPVANPQNEWKPTANRRLSGNGNPVVTTKTNILDVELPVELESAISTGWDHFDVLCAGTGMIPSTVAILTGLPGAGKTTFALQLADAITKIGNIALYNTCEESIYQVRRTVKRMKLQNGFIPSYETDTHDILKTANKLIEENPGKQVYLFVDSLQTIECNNSKALSTDQENTPGSTTLETSLLAAKPKHNRQQKVGAQQTQSVQAAWNLANWAKSTFMNVIIIGQVTKDGTFAGKQEVKHAVDMHISLHLDTDRKSPTYGERVVMVEKNRFGLANIYFPYDITAEGINIKNC